MRLLPYRLSYIPAFFSNKPFQFLSLWNADISRELYSEYVDIYRARYTGCDCKNGKFYRETIDAEGILVTVFACSCGRWCIQTDQPPPSLEEYEINKYY